MALISNSLTSKRIVIKKNYKTLEPIVFEVTIGSMSIQILCIYRPPKKLRGEYQLSLENELSHICNWASLQNNSVIVLGDLNLDRLRPETPEGKLLCDLEIEQSLECMITKPTRIEMRATKTTRTLIDVLLSNRPELFQCCGN